MFSQTVEYALRAIVHLATTAPDAQTTDQIAEITQVPAAYLSKILRELGKAGLVLTQRGIGGGVRLAATPDELSILDVVNAVDPIQRITTCPLKLASHGVRLCPLHRKLDDAMASIESAFQGTSLADILAESTGSVPLCDTVD